MDVAYNYSARIYIWIERPKNLKKLKENMLKFKSKSLDLHLICIIVPVSGRLNFLCSSFFWHNYKPIPIQYPTSGKNSN